MGMDMYLTGVGGSLLPMVTTSTLRETTNAWETHFRLNFDAQHINLQQPNPTYLKQSKAVVREGAWNRGISRSGRTALLVLLSWGSTFEVGGKSWLHLFPAESPMWSLLVAKAVFWVFFDFWRFCALQHRKTRLGRLTSEAGPGGSECLHTPAHARACRRMQAHAAAHAASHRRSGACNPDASQSQGLGPSRRVLEAFFMISLSRTPTLPQNRFFSKFSFQNQSGTQKACANVCCRQTHRNACNNPWNAHTPQ